MGFLCVSEEPPGAADFIPDKCERIVGVIDWLNEVSHVF